MLPVLATPRTSPEHPSARFGRVRVTRKLRGENTSIELERATSADSTESAESKESTESTESTERARSVASATSASLGSITSLSLLHSLHSFHPFHPFHPFHSIVAALSGGAVPRVPRFPPSSASADTMSLGSLSSLESGESELESETEDGPAAPSDADVDALALIKYTQPAHAEPSTDPCLAHEHEHAPVVHDNPLPVYNPGRRALLGPELEPCVSVVSVVSVASDVSLTSVESPPTVLRPLLATIDPEPGPESRFRIPELQQRECTSQTNLPKSAFKSKHGAQAEVHPRAPSPSSLPLPTHTEIPARNVRFAPHATYLTITEEHAPAWVRRSVRTTRPVRDDMYTLSKQRREPDGEQALMFARFSTIATTSTLNTLSTRSMLPHRPAPPPPTPTDGVMDALALGEPLHRVRCKEPVVDARFARESARPNPSPEPRVPMLAKARAWFTRHRPRRLAAA